MEQKSVDISTEKLEDISNSPPQKRTKCQPEENLPPLEAISINAAKTDDNLMGTWSWREQITYSISNQQIPLMPIISNHRGLVYSILFSLRRKIVLWLLRRILSQTPPVWRARELEEFGTSLLRNHVLLKITAWPFNVLRGDPKKDSRIGYLPHSGIWGSDRNRFSVQSFFFKVCLGLWIKGSEGETWRYRDPMPFWRFRNLSKFP